MNSTTTTAAQSALSVLARILLASIFVVSGIGKLFAPDATIGYIASTGLPLAPLGLVLAVALELGGGLLLALGVKTRLVALALALFSVLTALVFHNALGDQNQLIHFLKNFAMAGGLLQVAAFGAGAYSVERKVLRPAAAR